jgi:hypothetical protein
VIGVEKRRTERRALPLVFISLSILSPPFGDAVCYVHSSVAATRASLWEGFLKKLSIACIFLDCACSVSSSCR